MPQRTQVLRVVGRSTISVHLARHFSGKLRPEQARTRDEWDNRPSIAFVEDRSREAIEIQKHAYAVPRRGRPGEPWLDIFIGGPPPFEADDRWSKDRILDWADVNKSWLIKKLKGNGDSGLLPPTIGGEAGMLVSFELHLDERSPHIHATASPVVWEWRGPRISWNVKRGDILGISRKVPMKKRDNREEMSLLQDLYHSEVASMFGLARGRKGSTATHEEPDRERGRLERERDEARIRAEVAEAARDREASGAGRSRARQVRRAEVRRARSFTRRAGRPGPVATPGRVPERSRGR